MSDYKLVMRITDISSREQLIYKLNESDIRYDMVLVDANTGTGFVYIKSHPYRRYYEE